MATVRISSGRADARDGIVVEALPATNPRRASLRAAEAPTVATVRGTTVKLAIPLDKARANGSDDEDDDRVVPKHRRHRRDSLERREALLKGKEGSRRRQRWENDRLLNNPWAEPPLPSDWQVHPTHPVRIVPYYLAPLWEKNVAARREAERERSLRHHQAAMAAGTDGSSSRMPKELRARLKKTRAAKGLLYDLEEDVRRFVAAWERHADEVAVEDDEDDEEDEIVFVGRNGHMRDAPPSPKALHPKDDDPDRDLVVLENILAEKLVFGSLLNDEGAGFARWLVHSIAAYYGLQTWSVTRGNPARRDAYVGIDRQVSQRAPLSQGRLPVPLWGMV